MPKLNIPCTYKLMFQVLTVHLMVLISGPAIAENYQNKCVASKHKCFSIQSTSQQFYLGDFENNEATGIGVAITRDNLYISGRFKNGRPVYYDDSGRLSDMIMATEFNKLSAEQKLYLQHGLQSYGYYFGSIDGVWGRNTAIALVKYAYHWIPREDWLSTASKPQTLYAKLINFGTKRAKATLARTLCGYQFQKNETTHNKKTKLQKLLRDTGLYAGALDGVLGEQSCSGLKKYIALSDIDTKQPLTWNRLVSVRTKVLTSNQSRVSKTCNDDATACSALRLCSKAVKPVNGKKIWNTNTLSSSYVQEAKARGLDCGVTYETITNTGSNNVTLSRLGDWEAVSNGLHCWVENKSPSSVAKRNGRVVAVRRGSIILRLILDNDFANLRGEFTPGFPFTKVEIDPNANSLQAMDNWWLNFSTDLTEVNKLKAIKITSKSSRGTLTIDEFGTKNLLKLIDFARKIDVCSQTDMSSEASLNKRVLTCSDDPTKCSVIELCQQATGTNSSGEKFWRMDAALQTYVDTAKSTGVTCGVVSKVIETAKLETCEDDPTKCSVIELCQQATGTNASGEKFWRMDAALQTYVDTAKSTGLTCGVQEDLVAAIPEQKQVEPPAPKKVLKYTNRKALVIGNANYVDQTPLKNPINDAKAVAAKLEQIGFEVTYKENLKVREFGRTITDFEEALRGSDIGLFYYAGHGIEVEKQNYLIPIDAEIRTPRDVRFETVMLEDAISASLNTGKLSMVLVDACRDNPFAGQLGSGTRSIGRGLSVVEVETGPVNQIVSFAAASGEVAEDGSGNNSPYATALIELLDEPNLEVGKMFRLLGERVSDMTGGKQQPVKRDNLRGEDIFLVVSD